MISNLTYEQKEERHLKIFKFFGFIHYNWGDETKGSGADAKTGTESWQIYKGVHNWINASEEIRQAMKRRFYTENVDKEFESVVKNKTEEDRVEFQQYCQLYNCLGELGFPALVKAQSNVTNTKRTMYLLYILLQPMNVPYAWSLFLIAASMSFLERNNFIGNGPAIANIGLLQSFIEEECMNIFLMVFLIPAGQMMRAIIYLVLMIWSSVHVVMLAEAQLEADPNTIVLASLSGIVEYIKLSKTEFILAKNYIEIFILFICFPMVFVGRVAMIFPILYFQYIRIKYVSNQFQKLAFQQIINRLRSVLPTMIWDSRCMVWFRGWLSSYVQFDNGKNKKDDGDKNIDPAAADSSDSSFRNANEQKSNQGVQGDQQTSAKTHGQDNVRVQLGKGGNDKKGAKPSNNSQRVFADMMFKEQFKAPFEMSGEFPNMDDGPTVEEVDSDDLD